MIKNLLKNQNFPMKKTNPSSSEFLKTAKTLALKSLIVGAFLSLGVGLTLAGLGNFKTSWNDGDTLTAESLNDLAVEVVSLRDGDTLASQSLNDLAAEVKSLGEGIITSKLIYTKSENIGNNGWRDLNVGVLRNRKVFISLNYQTEENNIGGWGGQCTGFLHLNGNVNGSGIRRVLDCDSHTNNNDLDYNKEIDVIRIKSIGGHSDNLIFSVYPKGYTIKIYEIDGLW
jgi:hypothetical protein